MVSQFIQNAITKTMKQQYSIFKGLFIEAPGEPILTRKLVDFYYKEISYNFIDALTLT